MFFEFEKYTYYVTPGGTDMRKAVEANGDRKNGTVFELMKLYAFFFHEEGKLRDSFAAGAITEGAFISGRKDILEPVFAIIHDFCLGNVDKAKLES